MSGNQLADALDRIIDGAVTAGRIVGAVTLVRRNGIPLYERAAGFADREAGTPTAIDTVFRLGSLTKPLVAAGALALRERGRLDLDDPVTRFLPGFRPLLPDGTAPTITVRHLLTHTAGFGYPVAPEPEQQPGTTIADDPYWAAGVSSGADQPGLSLEEELRRIASVPLYFAPGSNWRYGVSTDVLGAVIAAAHGGSLGDAVAELVTVPLSMSDTAFTVRDASRLAVPYADGDPQATRMTDPQFVAGWLFSPGRAFDDGSFESGGAGMVGSAPDFMRLLETLRTGGAPILDARTVRDATANHVRDLRVDEPGWGFGLLSGVLYDAVAAGTRMNPGTLNWAGAWGHQWFVDPALGLTVTIFTNTAIEGCGGRFPADLLDAIYTNLQ